MRRCYRCGKERENILMSIGRHWAWCRFGCSDKTYPDYETPYALKYAKEYLTEDPKGFLKGLLKEKSQRAVEQEVIRLAKKDGFIILPRTAKRILRAYHF